MELWDLYDKNGHKTGEKHVRGEELPDDKYHLVVHVWIKNHKNQYLISQRAANRYSNPLKWECAGGSVLWGESSLDGALREVKEEVGIDLDPQKGKIVYSKVRHIVNGEKFNDIMDVWLFEYDGKADLSQATTDEVAQIKWMTKEEIQKLFDKGDFVWTLSYFFNEVCVDDKM